MTTETIHSRDSDENVILVHIFGAKSNPGVFQI